MSNTYENHYPEHVTRSAVRDMAAAYETGVSMAEVADEFNLGLNEFKAIRKVHRLRKGSDEVAGFDYPIDADMAAYITAEVGELIVEGGTGNEPATRTETADENPADWDEEDKYVYDAQQDRYIFFLKCYPSAPYVMEGTDVRQLVRAYSDYDDNPATINEIAREFEIPRQAVVEIKRILGITHDSPPRTPEEFDDGNIDEMVAEDVFQKRHRYHREFQKEDWKKIKKEAALFRDQNRFFEQTIKEHTESSQALAGEIDVPQISQPEELPSGGLLMNLQDLHVGKRGIIDADMDLEDYCSAIEEAFDSVLLKARRQAHLDELILVVGGDLSHIDTARGTTTKGTPQDLSANPGEIVAAAETLVINLVLRALQLEGLHVRLVFCKGNHDSLVGRLIFNCVANFFEGTDLEERITARRVYHSRRYVTYGDHLLCITHGDMSKKMLKKIANLMLVEARPQISSTRFQTIHTGHLHHEVVMDDQGLVRRQAPSPSLDDRYHVDKGYVGSRKLIQGILMDPLSTSDTVLNESIEQALAA
jgi:predicted DNA-binding protein YlxM (UPF0122 family)